MPLQMLLLQFRERLPALRPRFDVLAAAVRPSLIEKLLARKFLLALSGFSASPVLLDGTLQPMCGGCMSNAFLLLDEALVVVRIGFKRFG